MANVTAGGTNSETNFYGNGYNEKADIATSAAITAAARSGVVTNFTASCYGNIASSSRRA